MLQEGMKIRIIEMNNEPHYTGREGTVKRVSKDCYGETCVEGTWGGCSIYPELDEYVILHDWEMSGGDLEPVTVTAKDFDEAIEKAREIDPGYCAGAIKKS